jgi:hypothetical protein
MLYVQQQCKAMRLSTGFYMDADIIGFIVFTDLTLICAYYGFRRFRSYRRFRRRRFRRRRFSRGH